MFCMTECIVFICSRRNLPVNVYNHMMHLFLMNAMLFAQHFLNARDLWYINHVNYILAFINDIICTGRTPAAEPLYL